MRAASEAVVGLEMTNLCSVVIVMVVQGLVEVLLCGDGTMKW